MTTTENQTTLYRCWRHGVWYGDKKRPQCPACEDSGEMAKAPKIGGQIAKQSGYTCKTCRAQIISTIPTEHCNTCWHKR